MNQSTIYRRHEARLSRTYALKDDPRPAAIRVLSGLPGFCRVIPPYQPTTASTTTKSKVESTAGTTFSDDTVFTAHNLSKPTATSGTPQVPAPSGSTSMTSQAFTVAAVGGGILLARNMIPRTPVAKGGRVSPFAAAAVQGGGGAGLLLNLLAHHNRLAPKGVAAAAAAVALLFGTKVMSRDSSS